MPKLCRPPHLPRVGSRRRSLPNKEVEFCAHLYSVARLKAAVHSKPGSCCPVNDRRWVVVQNRDNACCAGCSSISVAEQQEQQEQQRWRRWWCRGVHGAVVVEMDTRLFPLTTVACNARVEGKTALQGSRTINKNLDQFTKYYHITLKSSRQAWH